jgi:hypothetical protein
MLRSCPGVYSRRGTRRLLPGEDGISGTQHSTKKYCLLLDQECGFHVTNNLVENNIFDSLRHAMLIQLGANGNVYGYNYSMHPVQGEGETNLNSGWDPPDISIHGHYAYMNLFEGNRVYEIGIGDYWGPAGPGNTYFRNKVIDEGIVCHDASHRQNSLGNITTRFKDTDGKSLEKLEHGNVVGGTIVWDPAIADHDLPYSYYLDSIPEFFREMVWYLSAGDQGQGQVRAHLEGGAEKKAGPAVM